MQFGNYIQVGKLSVRGYFLQTKDLSGKRVAPLQLISNSNIVSFLCSFQYNTGATGPKGDPGDSISVPEVTVSPTSLTVTQNQTATFYCSADGNPKPSVSWSKTSATGLVNTDGQGNKLQIKSAGYNDSGSYVCTATNVLGQAKKVVKLFVEGTFLEIEFNPGTDKESQSPRVV